VHADVSLTLSLLSQSRFMDMYMTTGTQKQLLGTETVRMLRAKGVNCRICGLSANDMKDSFLDAGADCFILKPFPCQKDALESELIRITSIPTSTEDGIM
jgi:CheY-like chemotaxis protein